jgi:uncharacterized membrane protein
MGFFYTPLPLWLAIGGWIVTVGVLALGIWKNPFRRLQDSTLQHVWFGIVVAVTVLWACNTWFEDGPAIHLLGATLMVTLFDWQLAMAGMAVATGLAAVVLDATWPGVSVTFLFILGHGFLTSAVAVAVACASGLLLQIVLADGRMFIPAGFTLAATLLVAGEALFTGLVTILITVYRPAWITTFDVRRYRLDRGPRV